MLYSMALSHRKYKDRTYHPNFLGIPPIPSYFGSCLSYPENNDTPKEQCVFNYWPSRARMTVENTFGRLKGRFKRFSKRVDMEVSSLDQDDAEDTREALAAYFVLPEGVLQHQE